MAGRKPKPTKLKVLNGNPGHRPLNTNEPEPESGIPTCPEWLGEAARKEWSHVSELLDNMNILTKADRNSLATYCYIVGEIETLSQRIADEGYTIITTKISKSGDEYEESRPNPLCMRLENYIKELRYYGGLFGLDPSSRSKINTGNKKPEKSRWEL